MKINEITQLLEAIAPPQYQESYDNSGLLVGHPETEVTGILFCLDALECIVDEALQKGCNLIIAHHPIVFKGLKRFNGNNYVERTIIHAIQNKVAIYAIHTNLDNVLYRGVNERIALQLGLEQLQVLVPKPGLDQVGAGVIGQLPNPVEERLFLQEVKEKMKAGCVRHTQLLNKPIQRVAVCGGAGSSFLPFALAQRADIYITADFKYHEFFDAENRLVIADIGHFESEQYTIPLLYDIIWEKYPNFALNLTEHNTNPVNYL